MFNGMSDIGLTWDGDLMFDEGGDLTTVSGDEWVIREINKRVRTTNPDWPGHPNVGAGVDEFVGRPNSRSLGLLLEQSIYSALTTDSFLLPATIRVEAIPTSISSIATLITVTAPGQDRLVTVAVYDVKNGIQEVIPERRDIKPLQSAHYPRAHEVTDNKYMLRRGR